MSKSVWHAQTPQFREGNGGLSLRNLCSDNNNSERFKCCHGLWPKSSEQRLKGVGVCQSFFKSAPSQYPTLQTLCSSLYKS